MNVSHLASRAGLPAALILGLCLTVAPAGAQEANLGKPVDFPNAGIQIAFPRAQEPAIAVGAASLASRMEKDGNDWKTLCSLIALPIVDANRFPGAEKMAQGLVDDFVRRQGNLISDRVSSAEMKAMDRPGWRLVARLEDQQKRQEVQVASVWTTEAAPGVPALCFVVLYRSRGGDANGPAAAAAAVCGSAKSIPVVPNAQLDISALGAALESKEQGFALRIPEGWSLLQAGPLKDGDFQLATGAVDYSVGGASPNLILVVSPARRLWPPDGIYPPVDQKLADRLNEQRKQVDQGYTPRSARVVRLAGLPGVECMGIAEHGKGAQTQTARQVHHAGRIYSLTMTIRGKDEKKVVELLDKITAEFRLLGAGVPATRESPATAPAEPK